MNKKSVDELVEIGRFPSYEEAPNAQIVNQYQKLIESIVPPVTDDEATELASLLSTDDFFGLAWTVVHLVETAPDWRRLVASVPLSAEWREVLLQRANGDS